MNISDSFLAPSLNGFVFDLFYSPQNKSLTFNLHAYFKRLIIQFFNKIIVFFPILFQILHFYGRLTEQFLSNIVVDCHRDRPTIVTKFNVCIVFYTYNIALAFKALRRVDIYLLRTEVAVFE